MRCVLDRMWSWCVGQCCPDIHTRGLSRSVQLDMAVVIELQEQDTEQARPQMTDAALPGRLLHCPPLCTPGCQECGGN